MTKRWDDMYQDHRARRINKGLHKIGWDVARTAGMPLGTYYAHCAPRGEWLFDGDIIGDKDPAKVSRRIREAIRKGERQKYPEVKE